MNKCWEDVRVFHQKFNSPVSDRPVMLDSSRSDKRYRWMQEELDEFLESSDIYGQADAMIDLIYFALGTMVEMGLRPQELFDAVHKANMAKLWPDGQPHYNAEGKVIKSPAWVDPHHEMKAIIDRAAAGV